MPRPELDEDLRPLSDFRSHVASCIRQVRKTKRPLVITHHGKSAAILLDVSEYESLMRRMEVLEDIRVAEAQLAQGKGVPHESALRQVLGRRVKPPRPGGAGLLTATTSAKPAEAKPVIGRLARSGTLVRRSLGEGGSSPPKGAGLPGGGG